jgi:hypothetical protein
MEGIGAREHVCSGGGVVGSTRVDDLVRGGWGHRHGAKCGGDRGVVPSSSQWGPRS